MAASMFMNSNSLPIALMQSLVVTVPGLKWEADDNEDTMLGRALTYLVLYSTLGMVVCVHFIFVVFKFSSLFPRFVGVTASGYCLKQTLKARQSLGSQKCCLPKSGYFQTMEFHLIPRSHRFLMVNKSREYESHHMVLLSKHNDRGCFIHSQVLLRCLQTNWLLVVIRMRLVTKPILRETNSPFTDPHSNLLPPATSP
jgi:hypothetical protein